MMEAKYYLKEWGIQKSKTFIIVKLFSFRKPSTENIIDKRPIPSSAAIKDDLQRHLIGKPIPSSANHLQRHLIPVTATASPTRVKTP